MAMIWVICGAGRRVGKTHLAHELCRLLPSAIYVKHGCSPKKDGKPRNFFRSKKELDSFLQRNRDAHKHIVVESNSLARREQSDIILYVDGIPGQTNFRKDAEELRDKSHIRIQPGASIRQWKRVLKKVLDNTTLCESVCDILASQMRYISRPGLEIRTKVWLVMHDGRALGSGLAALLENIARRGSLREAAKAANISYRHAWDLIRSAEKHIGKPLVLAQPGGSGGGQSSLAEEGRRLLDIYRRLNRDVADFADERLADCLEKEHANVRQS